MSNRTQLNIALFALLGILGLVAVYRPGLETPTPPPPLLDLDPTRVDRIRIERLDRAPVVLTKAATRRWVMEQPYRIDADPRRIGALLELIRAPSTSRHPLGDRALEPFGLAPPAHTLEFGPQRLAIGHRTALDDRTYVRVGSVLHLVDAPRALDSLNESDAGAWVDHALVPEDAEPIGFTLSAPPTGAEDGGPMTDQALVLRLEDGRWQVDPAPPGLSGDDAPTLVDAWRHAQALAVVGHRPERQTSPPSPAPEVRIRIRGQERPLVYRIQSLKPALVLHRPDQGLDYHLPASAVDRLLRLPSRQATPQATPDEPPPPETAQPRR